MSTCIFCDIINQKIPADIVYESDRVLAFSDIIPQAPIHKLIIPKKHITNILGFEKNDDTLFSDIFSAIQAIVKTESVLEQGFRIVNNTGNNGGQTVHHVHFHLLGGRHLHWPPG
jgi:histidine triad (HIT) family protein